MKEKAMSKKRSADIVAIKIAAENGRLEVYTNYDGNIVLKNKRSGNFVVITPTRGMDDDE